MTGRGVRKPRRRALAILAVGAGPVVGCSVAPPVFNALAPGCYETATTGWSSDLTEFVGFTLPERVQLDSALRNPGSEWRRGWPTDWDLRTEWTSVGREWRRLPGDTIIMVPIDAQYFHDLGGDSIIVRWYSRKGGMTAYLAPTPDGFEGLAQPGPRQLARGIANPTIRLRRRTCVDSTP